MATTITVTGNLTADPTMRVTRAGATVTNFRIASTERRFDRSSERWVDGNQFFANVACWRSLAQNTYDSLRKGTPVVVTGRISTRTYTTEQEESHTVYEIEAETVAPDLSFGTATFRRVSRSTRPPVATDAAGVPTGPSFETPFDLVDEHPVDAYAADTHGGEPDPFAAAVPEELATLAG